MPHIERRMDVDGVGLTQLPKIVEMKKRVKAVAVQPEVPRAERDDGDEQ